ncbi:MAG TPA: phosphodiester glycosidase family protein [Actinomycetota bacterium]|nr:phosphodiester glycosidase family protein [Actinomycetota bacterium]
MKPITGRGAAAAAAVVCLISLLVAVPAGADREGDPEGRTARAPIIKTRRIAPGLTFTRIVQRKIPRRTFVLRMKPSKPVTLDVTLATASLPSNRTVQQIAKAHGALAAVNGDFGSPSLGRPSHAFAQDGNLVQAGGGPLFALSRDESTVFVGSPPVVVEVANRDTGQAWQLDRWNQGPPPPGEIAGFSPEGGTLELPPEYSCSVHLAPDGKTSFDQNGTGVVRDFLVDQSACTPGRMSRDGGVVLSAAPATDEATHLLAMVPGTRLRLRWSVGWKGVFDLVGGMPVLVSDGRNVVPPCSSAFCRRHPRTGIGVARNGDILLVVVDGRREKWSTGATLREFANIMRNLGAVQALNLDGGGSTTMVIRDKIVNKPSEARPRRVTNAVLVLPGPDPGET